MPRQGQRKQFLNFVGGLHTEASSLNFPENTAKDLNNVDLLRDGSVKRRRGLELESSYEVASATSADLELDAITVHEWKSVDGNGEQNFLAIQTGLNVAFHQLGSSTTSADSVGSIDLTPYVVDSTASVEPISAASGKGRLFIVGKKIEPIYVEYDSDTQAFSITQLSLKVRDLEGLDDGLEVDERPTSLSNSHLYNLQNQGWKNPPHISGSTNKYDPDALAYTTDNGSHRYFGNLITITRYDTGRYPSNADVWYFAKASAADRPVGIGAFEPELLYKYSYGNTAAGRGHFILDAFDRNRTTASGVSGIYDTDRDLDTRRPISVEFYSGRVWYLMPNGKLLYSQILEDIDDAERCYQQADPTAEDINELVATDGGELEIIGVGKAIKLLAVGFSLLLFADNGVWSIAGSDNSVFSATSQFITKITDLGALGPDSVVSVEDTVAYWSIGGIYILTASQVTGQLSPQNLSQETIQTFYEDLGSVAKIYSRGKYDTQKKKIFWLYNDNNDSDGVSNRYVYNKALIFDFSLQSFYKYSLPYASDGTPKVSALIEKQNFGFSNTDETVVDSNGNTVVDGSSNTVTASITSQTSATETRLQAFVVTDYGGTEGVYSSYSIFETGIDQFGPVGGVTRTGWSSGQYVQNGQTIVVDFPSSTQSPSNPFYMSEEILTYHVIDQAGANNDGFYVIFKSPGLGQTFFTAILVEGVDDEYVTLPTMGVTTYTANVGVPGDGSGDPGCSLWFWNYQDYPDEIQTLLTNWTVGSGKKIKFI